MSDFVDLHSHSTASDGTLPPAEVARLAKASGLSAWALTDHDTIAGVLEAADASRELGLDFLPGIEISAEFPHPGTLHILGYGVDPHSPTLTHLTETLIAARDNRNPRIINKLNQLGVSVTMSEWEQASGGTVVGRPHLAAILVRKGYVSSIKQAFEKYLGQGAPAYFDKERLAPAQALELIRQSGGLAVLAHPVQLRLPDDSQLQQILRQLIDLGLQGMEVIHSDHTSELIERYTALADRFQLVKTGGSDFHGVNKKDIALGSAKGRRIPRQFYDDLRLALDSHSRACTR